VVPHTVPALDATVFLKAVDAVVSNALTLIPTKFTVDVTLSFELLVPVGAGVGEPMGAFVGVWVGDFVGAVGAFVGVWVGAFVGVVGAFVGVWVGAFVGVAALESEIVCLETVWPYPDAVTMEIVTVEELELGAVHVMALGLPVLDLIFTVFVPVQAFPSSGETLKSVPIELPPKVPSVAWTTPLLIELKVNVIVLPSEYVEVSAAAMLLEADTDWPIIVPMLITFCPPPGFEDKIVKSHPMYLAWPVTKLICCRSNMP